MHDPRKDPPLQSETQRSLWIGWGVEVLLMVIAYFMSGSFLPLLCASFAIVMIMRGMWPGMFAQHFDAQLIQGTPYRRSESPRSWLIALLACIVLTCTVDRVYKKAFGSKPDIATHILNGVETLFKKYEVKQTNTLPPDHQAQPESPAGKVRHGESNKPIPPIPRKNDMQAAIDFIQSYLHTRTIVYICPDWNVVTLEWRFAVCHMGDNVAVNNVEILGTESGKGLLGQFPIKSGLTVNPEPGVPHRMETFRLNSSTPDDERFVFTINDAKESITQDLVLQRTNPASFEQKTASRVWDGRTHELLLECRDDNVTGLDTSWHNQDATAECLGPMLFRVNAVLPNQIKKQWPKLYSTIRQ